LTALLFFMGQAMKSSPFYPSKPWPITNITNHPAFQLLRKSADDDPSGVDVFYDIAAFAERVQRSPDRYCAGVPLSELASLCRSAKSYQGVVQQLVHMNVIRIDVESDHPRIVPCMALESTEQSSDRKSATYYLSEKVISAVKAEAARTGLSVSKVVEAALFKQLSERKE
jgi:hypothetical protein